jgi:hypothetical protein
MSEYGNCPDCGGAIPCDCYAGCQDAPNPDSLAVIFPPTKPVEQISEHVDLKEQARKGCGDCCYQSCDYPNCLPKGQT